MWAKMQQQTRIVTTFHNVFIRGGSDSFFKYVKLDRDVKRIEQGNNAVAERSSNYSKLCMHITTKFNGYYQED